ncbi:protease inhibitor I42 family protein [Rhodoplanes sp.]|uniref:protease inhibitor I42 family protein n=1 Tax=Rhodoplanes sp. TaxID=1968906 RepID=UPI0025FA3161|nr:protease inhibitor I42 family protein [Rhodoplanes sp.]
MGVIRTACSAAIPTSRSAFAQPASALLLAGLLVTTAPSAMPAAAQTSPLPPVMRSTAAPLRLAPGEETTIVLEENLTTGYAWRLDTASGAPSCVVITDLGHQQRGGNAPAIGAAGLHRWKLRAQSVCHADLRFVYQRPWEQHPVREHLVSVDVR